MVSVNVKLPFEPIILIVSNPVKVEEPPSLIMSFPPELIKVLLLPVFITVSSPLPVVMFELLEPVVIISSLPLPPLINPFEPEPLT